MKKRVKFINILERWKCFLQMGSLSVLKFLTIL